MTINIRDAARSILKYHSDFPDVWKELNSKGLFDDPITDNTGAESAINDIVTEVRNFMSDTDKYSPSSDQTREYDENLLYYLEDLAIYLGDTDLQDIHPLALALKYNFLITDSFDRISVYDNEKMTELGLPVINLPSDIRDILTNRYSTVDRKKLNILLSYMKKLTPDDVSRIVNNFVEMYVVSQRYNARPDFNEVLKQISDIIKGLTMISNSSHYSAYTIMNNRMRSINTSSYFGDVYESTIRTTSDFEFSYVSKISRESTNNDVILHEYIVGEILNRFVLDMGGQGFQYTYDYFNATPPASYSEDTPVNLDLFVNAYRMKNESILETNPQVSFQWIPDSITMSQYINNAILDNRANQMNVVRYVRRLGGSRREPTSISGPDAFIYNLFLLFNNLRYANERCGFVHGDLHLDNVLVSQPSSSLVPNNYNVFYQDNQFLITLDSSAAPFIVDYGQSSLTNIPLNIPGIGNKLLSQNRSPLFGYAEDTRIDVYRFLGNTIDRLVYQAYAMRNRDLLNPFLFIFGLYLSMYGEVTDRQDIVKFMDSLYDSMRDAQDTESRNNSGRISIVNNVVGSIYMPHEDIDVSRVYDLLYEWMSDREFIPETTTFTTVRTRPFVPLDIRDVSAGHPTAEYICGLMLCKDYLTRYNPVLEQRIQLREYTRSIIQDILNIYSQRDEGLVLDPKYQEFSPDNFYLALINAYDAKLNEMNNLAVNLTNDREIGISLMYRLALSIKYAEMYDLLKASGLRYETNYESERARMRNNINQYSEELANAVIPDIFQRGIYSIFR